MVVDAGEKMNGVAVRRIHARLPSPAPASQFCTCAATFSRESDGQGLSISSKFCKGGDTVGIMTSLYGIPPANPKLGADLLDGFATPGTVDCDIRETGNAVSMPRALAYVLLGYVLLGLLSVVSC